jgi:hypothetical protein
MTVKCEKEMEIERRKEGIIEEERQQYPWAELNRHLLDVEQLF